MTRKPEVTILVKFANGTTQMVYTAYGTKLGYALTQAGIQYVSLLNIQRLALPDNVPIRGYMEVWVHNENNGNNEN